MLEFVDDWRAAEVCAENSYRVGPVLGDLAHQIRDRVTGVVGERIVAKVFEMALGDAIKPGGALSPDDAILDICNVWRDQAKTTHTSAQEHFIERQYRRTGGDPGRVGDARTKLRVRVKAEPAG